MMFAFIKLKEKLILSILEMAKPQDLHTDSPSLFSCQCKILITNLIKNGCYPPFLFTLSFCHQ